MTSKTIGQVVFVGLIAGAGAFLWFYEPYPDRSEEQRQREALIADIPVGLPLPERLHACLGLPSCEALDAEIMNLLQRAREQGQLDQALARAAGEGRAVADGLRLIYDRFNRHYEEELEGHNIFDDVVFDIQWKLGLRDPEPLTIGLHTSNLLAFFLTDQSTPREHVDVLLEPFGRDGLSMMPPLEKLPRTVREAWLEHIKRKRAEEAAKGLKHRQSTEQMLRAHQERLEASLRP